MRKPWIGTIHGLRCPKYGSVLCAGNPWIAQLLRDPRIAQPGSVHTCHHAFDWKSSWLTEKPSKNTSPTRLRRRKGARWSVERKGRKSWHIFQLMAKIIKLQIIKFSLPLNGMQRFRLAHDVLFREVYEWLYLYTITISAIIAGCNTSDIEEEPRNIYWRCYWGLLLLAWSLLCPATTAWIKDSYIYIHQYNYLVYLSLAASSIIIIIQY